MPECQLTLAQAAIYMATAPKSNASATAVWMASDDVKEQRTVPVPKHLRNASTALMRREGYGKGYRYVHDDPQARHEMTCMPPSLEERRYFKPSPRKE